VSRRGRALPVRLPLALLACLLLASCWLPDRFVAEVRLARNGDFGLTYDGEMIWVPLAEALSKGEIKGEDLQEKIAALSRDLSRDISFTNVAYQGNGRFRVRYEREGFLKPLDEFIFPRRNNPIITVKTKEDGTAEVRVAGLGSDDKTRITDAGLKMTGKFRVVTDAMPYGGNPQAATPRGFRKFMVYDWTIRGINDPPPLLRLNMTRAVRMPQ
jgi:hypothetical protein